MTETEEKAMLHRYLQRSREAMVWKLDGLSEYDTRRPMTATGTNLLGLVKHLASVEFGYFADSFGRPHTESLPWWSDDAEPNDDMWATADQSREQVVDLYHRAWAFADATIEELPLDAAARVPWWPADRADTTLRRVVVHMIDETSRHAGHADIIRELIDGAAGHTATNSNLDRSATMEWAAHVRRLDRIAREAADRVSEPQS